MGLTEEELQEGLEKAQAKELIQEREDKNQAYRNEILDHTDYLENIRDGILRVERQKVVVTPDMDKDLQDPIMREYVRMPDGVWLPYDQVKNNEDLWQRLTEKGIGEHPEELATFVVNHLASNANKNIATSHLDGDEDIPTMGMHSEITLLQELKAKRDYFGIEPDEARYIVRSIVHPNVRAVLGKSEDGGFVQQILSSMKMMIKRNEGDNDERSGFAKALP